MPNENITQFDRQSAERISKAVQKSERESQASTIYPNYNLGFQQQFQLGKPRTTIEKGDYGIVELFKRDTYNDNNKGSETGTNILLINVYNRFGKVTTDDFVFVSFIDGGLELFVADPCEETPLTI